MPTEIRFEQLKWHLTVRWPLRRCAIITLAIGVARGGTGAMAPPIHPRQKQGFWQSRRQGDQGVRSPNRHAWAPIKKLTLLKTVVFVLNFKLCPHPSDERILAIFSVVSCLPFLEFFFLSLKRCCSVLYSYFKNKRIYYYWHIYPPITRKRSMRCTSSLRSCRPSVYHTKMGESR